jgi:4-amino-4-deoxy-L-arabinose transferase-like glycosyltransferase
MIDRLARQPNAVYLLLAAYFAVNVIIRLSTPASLELDESQQLFLAQWLAIGYDSQPPFYNWLQYGVVKLLGDTVASLTLLKNLMLFLSYLLFGLAAQMVIRDRVLAVVATLGLITIPQIGYEAQRDLTHTVALLFAACLFIYFLIRALQWPTVVNYALTGVAIGIGMLSKYNFILLPAAAALALASDRQFRIRLFDPRIVLTILIAGVIVAPHALWFLGHIEEATQLTMLKLTRGVGGDPDQLKGILALVEAVAAITLPTLAVFAIAFGRTLLRSWSAESRWTRLLGRILVAATLLLLLLVLTGVATYIRHRWLVPLFFLLPLYLGAKIDALGEIPLGAQRRFGAIALAVMIVVPAMLFGRPFLGAWGDYSKQSVPYGPAATEILASNKDRPSIILAGDRQLAGNLRLHAGDIPLATPGYEHLDAPFAFDPAHPVLVVWRRGDGQAAPGLPDRLKAWLEGKGVWPGKQPETSDAALPYHYGRDGDAYHFGYAWIYPPAGS